MSLVMLLEHCYASFELFYLENVILRIGFVLDYVEFISFTFGDKEMILVIEAQFWYSIKKVQGTDSYEFLLANKKYTVNAEVFRIILDICPIVEGVDFTNDDTALTFLIDLGYKGLLYKHTNMFVDHMHQP
ncbi:hypothetical protein Tco_1343077 [Tanacetum coccineum]